MLQVSNMNEWLKQGAFWRIIKKIISYLISSQLDQVCDMKIDDFASQGITHIVTSLVN